MNVSQTWQMQAAAMRVVRAGWKLGSSGRGRGARHWRAESPKKIPLEPLLCQTLRRASGCASSVALPPPACLCMLRVATFYRCFEALTCGHTLASRFRQVLAAGRKQRDGLAAAADAGSECSVSMFRSGEHPSSLLIELATRLSISGPLVIPALYAFRCRSNKACVAVRRLTK